MGVWLVGTDERNGDSSMRLLSAYRMGIGFGKRITRNDHITIYEKGGGVCQYPNVKTSVSYWSWSLNKGYWWAEKRLAKEMNQCLKSFRSSSLSEIALTKGIRVGYRT